ncbi:cytochrome oxidase assembly [Nitrosococcus halophilus Nc 4]|uniref:Cytochrome oxidase assembly n=1 Tax=Nitrosococcus halophilus (strain Nc4) TaxID=472759 RepID=D5C4A1_NITHN|nr:COX15/CtaA family protein [Nitrosococcus halophilus]ADE13289.1 cytochrome oxidase assembly [Nitrosococcus halophilus Nc 4]
MSPRFHTFAVAASLLALVVVVFGAYVRLSDAGLSCPDWPGCYEQLLAPTTEQQIDQASLLYPDRPVESDKAWKEMIHRYLAGILGLLILGLAIAAWRNRSDPRQRVALPIFLVGLVGFQAALGMWTVTLLVQPAIVTLHLLGGLAVLSLVWWLALRQRQAQHPMQRIWYSPAFKTWSLIGLFLLVLQIILGGWTSTNYAGFFCPDFPTCQGQWWPNMHFREAFTFWQPLGENYEGGRLAPEAATAIHVVHRIGAMVVLIVLGAIGLRAGLGRGTPALRGVGWVVVALLLTQVALGIATAMGGIPLALAVAHNAVAALLLLAVVTLNHLLHPTGYQLRGATRL